jgi:hypothetical protein
MVRTGVHPPAIRGGSRGWRPSLPARPLQSLGSEEIQMKRIGMILATVFAATGCPGEVEETPEQALVGDWQGRELIGGERNVLSIDDNMHGESVIYFYLDDGLYYAEFEVEIADVAGDRVELDFECDGNCASLDFTMDCELTGDSMSCDGSDLFSEYAFDWERE